MSSRARAPAVTAYLLTMLLCGCGGDDGAPLDAGVHDANLPSSPWTMEVDDGSTTLTVRSDPLRFDLERSDGSLVLRSASSVAFELGIGNPSQYHQVIEAAPRGVRFLPADFGVGMENESTARLRDAAGRSVMVSVESPAEGIFRLRLLVEDDEDLALVRARLRSDDGSYQGLGERFYGADARGWVVPMQLSIVGGQARTSGHNEHHVPIPFFVSSEGYGVFARTRATGAFDVAATDAGEVRATFEGNELDLWFFVHDEPREVVAMYTRQTGLPILPPRWAYAPMHWRNEWADRSVLEEDMARIRAEDIPCTTFWIDNPWQVSYNDFRFDETRFPDSAEMLDGMRAEGYVPLVWSTPYLDEVADGASPANEAEELFLTARDSNYLVGIGDDVYLSPAAPGARGALVDFTNDDAASFWEERARIAVDLGVRAFKLDYGEDIVPDLIGARPGFRFSDGRDERELHNLFNVLYHEPYRAALDAGGGDDGGFLLVRASAWGGQSVADIVWPGDLDNDLREAGTTEVGGLPAAISALISLAASGFPNFGSDTGGYRGSMPDRESLLRWAEHTAFTPILQLGGAGEHHNPWLYDAEAGDIYRVLARAHMDLVPYFRMHAIRASETGYPPVSHPSLAYPDDLAGYTDPNAYLLGEDLFVAPVVQPAATTRALHLPPGSWVHWFTNERFEGPADVTVDAPIGTPPIFIRQGAVLPLLPSDLDTLVEVEAPVVGPTQRPYLRARWLPAGTEEITTEEGLSIRVTHANGSPSSVAVTPLVGDGLTDLRIQVDLAHADPPMTSVTTVRSGATTVAPTGSATDVRAGCDGVCWAVEDEVLWLSVRSDDPTTIEIE